MKKILVATVFTAFAVTPALAQQGPWMATPAQAPVQQFGAPAQTLAYAPNQPGAGFMGGPSDVVIENGIIVGRDPDADVRLQLRREAQAGEPELNTFAGSHFSAGLQ